MCGIGGAGTLAAAAADAAILQAACDERITRTNAAGEPDNVIVLLIAVDGGS